MLQQKVDNYTYRPLNQDEGNGVVSRWLIGLDWSMNGVLYCHNTVNVPTPRDEVNWVISQWGLCFNKEVATQHWRTKPVCKHCRACVVVIVVLMWRLSIQAVISCIIAQCRTLTFKFSNFMKILIFGGYAQLSYAFYTCSYADTTFMDNLTWLTSVYYRSTIRNLNRPAANVKYKFKK